VPDVYIRRKMYTELGGYRGYCKTPFRELQECRISIIAEWKIQAERDAEMKKEHEEQKRELERQKARRR